MGNRNKIVVISRQYGSGGHVVGERLAQLVGVRCYNSALIQMAAEREGVPASAVQNMDEKKGVGAKLFAMGGINSSTGISSGTQTLVRDSHAPMNDRIFHTQADIIRELAKEQSCVLIGRCADAALEDMTDIFCISVFIYADLDYRIRRTMDRDHCTEREAAALVKRGDKERAAYYNYYTDKQWGRPESYDVMLNSGSLGIDHCASLLKGLWEGIPV